MKKLMLRLLVSLILIVMLGGCGSESGVAPPVLQTEILAVHVEPNPVAQGDTTILTVVIEDSLDQRFEYVWSIKGQDLLYTSERTLIWVAVVEPGQYGVIVRVDNGDLHATAPTRGFSITVVGEDSTPAF